MYTVFMEVHILKKGIDLMGMVDSGQSKLGSVIKCETYFSTLILFET